MARIHRGLGCIALTLAISAPAGYALAKLGAIPNVFNYVDAAHHGWLGWDDNFGASAQIMFQAANASGSTAANVHGFITNTANYSVSAE